MRANHPMFGVIGAGFSGSLLTVHLLRSLPDRGRVHLIERRPGFGRGLAYSTGNPSHLLNVRASRMSAFDDDPDHFLRWLDRRADCPDAHPQSFVPRAVYGDYVQGLLGEQLWGDSINHGLYLFPDEAVGLERMPHGVKILMACGRTLTVDKVVLAVGNFPPEAPRAVQGLASCPHYLADPWDDEALAAIAPEMPVLVIGSGLTMVDFVLSMLERGHRGPITALSRHGLLPHRHADGPAPQEWRALTPPLRLSALLQAVRQRAEQQDWRAVVDGMRPHLPDWWRGMSHSERRRFLRHLRPWWDIHRHRMAPEVADRLEDVLRRGQLTVLAGQIVEVRERADGVDVTYRPRGTDARCGVPAGRIINCSGPCSDYSRVTQPLLRRLLTDGVVRPDPLRLGLEVDGELRLVDRQGCPNDWLYALGPVTRGSYWETTAVPEIRRQAKWLAERLISEPLGAAV